MKTKEALSLLKEKLLTAGLSQEAADIYVWFTHGCHQADIKLGLMKPEDLLPSDEQLHTLAEAQRIVLSSAMNKINPRQLHVTEISRFLKVPDTQWKEAKKLIAKFFDRKESVVDTVYNGDEGWLLKTAEECLDAALYINHFCLGNSDLAWKIFRHAGLVGREKNRKDYRHPF